jgi:hypothetical protein
MLGHVETTFEWVVGVAKVYTTDSFTVISGFKNLCQALQLYLCTLNAVSFLQLTHKIYLYSKMENEARVNFESEVM